MACRGGCPTMSGQTPPPGLPPGQALEHWPDWSVVAFVHVAASLLQRRLALVEHLG